MRCPNCGASVADTRRFCGKCGTALTASAPPADLPTAAAPPSAAVPPPGPPPGPAPAPASPSSWGPPAAPPPQWGPPPAMPPAGATDPFAPPELTSSPGPSPWAGHAGPPPQYPPPGYGGPPPYPPGQYPGAPGSWPGYGYAPPHTNGLAVTSFVLGLAGWLLCGVGSVVAIVLGFVARDQIKRSWGSQTGGELATAGIVLGFIGAGFWLIALIVNLVHAVGSTG
jgi:hypothetical protein